MGSENQTNDDINTQCMLISLIFLEGHFFSSKLQATCFRMAYLETHIEKKLEFKVVFENQVLEKAWGEDVSI